MLALSLRALTLPCPARSKYYGCRNEQAASYAAGAVGYLTGRPGACIVVPGPGAIHAVAGMANSSINCWPMLCIAGSSELSQDGLGAFQESWNPQGGAQMQIKYPEPACKYTAKIDNADRIPFFVEQAVRYSICGRPGAAFLDVPADLMSGPVTAAGQKQPPRCPNPPLQ